MIATNLVGFEDLPQTIPHYCLESFRQNNKPDALCFKGDDGWHRISGDEALDRVRRIALGLSTFGNQKGDRVAIISENRPEWSLTDLALLCLRAVIVPIYTTQAVDQIRYHLENSGSKMIFVSGRKLYKHAAEAIRSVESIEHVVFFDADVDDASDDMTYAATLDEVIASGEQLSRSDGIFDELLSKVETDDLATIIYTSGTTGEPKGVMLTHGNFVSNVVAISTRFADHKTGPIAGRITALAHI